MQLLFWLRKSVPGYGTIVMRITIDNARAEYSTGITVRHEVWEFRDQLFYPASEYQKNVVELDSLKKRANEIHELLYRARKPQTAAIIRMALQATESIPLALIFLLMTLTASLKKRRFYLPCWKATIFLRKIIN